MTETANFQKIEVITAQELKDWLYNNQNQKQSIWLITFKKIVSEKYLSTSDVLDELLCFGWIDGIRRKLDDTRTMQLISPRKTEHWAKSYKERVEKLIIEERIHESGLRSIEISKRSGLWDFMDDVDQLIIPKDLLEALGKLNGATEFFHAINNSSKRFVLRWIKLAKTAKTRSSRIDQIAMLSANGEKLKGS